ncbi:acetyl-CoA carboxylase, carboxyltransferase subunit beta [Cerasicoccus arenae]|uniref:Acetyl-coenzyme A carboxylase carboxyl transferase subunit beta n=1 Tax=Cerasicoccus arenae TaxID=424488 RepID=A0A8J3D9V4_9BACT|nr:acetyl-CoA carboxylase, carboxyltransferase subunit beta [Cerasicoccus arenae]MBK1859493.1 acetyl-CoA carboxylase carboxyltransferase subunit beta [Cerasicoccus arenae]GHB94961.1 acetyl-coenzyme A carboxylase carboxyl transferase subunit beta [Cerasicoccus arenae]
MAIFRRPQYSTVRVKKKDIPAGLWTKCPESSEIVYNKELEENWMVVPKSGYHFQLKARRRMELLLDDGSFEEHDESLSSVDPLEFVDNKPYHARIEAAQQKTGENDALVSGVGTLDGMPVSLAVMDFSFNGGSMGSVVGEKITRAIERATASNMPVIVVCASGGARMQEGILSLMQMAKTSAALARHSAAGLPYISVLTNPTMAGVMASFASLGDVIIAEPKALIGFAGPRVIKETTQQDLPAGFQTSEFLLKRGLIDQIVPRLEMKARLATLLKAFMRSKS